jgi:molybdenum cofactor cytidylyltransferase
MIQIAAIVLAAGRSTRFLAAGGEGTKLAAPLGHKALARYAAEAALGSSARPVVAVTGYARLAVEAALAGLSLQFVHNARFASGLASSLRTGLAALSEDVGGAIVLLGDMPAVSSGLIDGLIDAFQARPGALAVAPRMNGRRGNPILLGRGLFPAVARLEGDVGARSLLDQLPAERLVEIPVDGFAVSLDVDTPEALEAARRALKS